MLTILYYIISLFFNMSSDFLEVTRETEWLGGIYNIIYIYKIPIAFSNSIHFFFAGTMGTIEVSERNQWWIKISHETMAISASERGFTMVQLGNQWPCVTGTDKNWRYL